MKDEGYRIIESRWVITDEVMYIGAAGDAENKPTTLARGAKIADGSWYMETDTKKVKIYNESSESWKEW